MCDNAEISSRKLRVATRQSALALAQTKMAADAIATAAGIEYELVPLTTEGDRRLDKSLASFGGKGVFIKELEVALLEGRADIAVHSLKDMPAEVLPEFKIAAVMNREDPRDAFVARGRAQGTVYGPACRCASRHGQHPQGGTAEIAPSGFGIRAYPREHPDAPEQTGRTRRRCACCGGPQTHGPRRPGDRIFRHRAGLAGFRPGHIGNRNIEPS